MFEMLVHIAAAGALVLAGAVVLMAQAESARSELRRRAAARTPFDYVRVNGRRS
jgi:hypothetical protein